MDITSSGGSQSNFSLDMLQELDVLTRNLKYRVGLEGAELIGNVTDLKCHFDVRLGGN